MPDVIIDDLLAAEHPRAVLQVDMVGCEHAETCLAVTRTARCSTPPARSRQRNARRLRQRMQEKKGGGGQSWVPRKLGQLNTHTHAEKQNTHTHLLLVPRKPDVLDSQCLGALLLQVAMVGSAAEAPPHRLRRRGSAAQAPPQRLAWLSSTGTARCSSPSARKKQTEKCHVTDVRMSKIAKDAQHHFACLMYDLLKTEHPRAVLQTDMVGCEHGDQPGC